MKIKISIIILTFFLSLMSCQLSKPVEQKSVIDSLVVKRNYSVRLSNNVGSDWYECDSIKWLSERRLQLKNTEDSSYFVDISVPQNVVIRIYPIR